MIKNKKSSLFFKNICTPLVLSATFSSLVSLCFTSCGEEDPEHNIQEIRLNADKNYLCSGESIQINKTITPTSAKNKPVAWEISTPLEGVSINQEGVVSVASSMIITDPTMVIVTAYDPSNEQVFGTINVIIAKDVTSNVIGFLGNELYCRDAYGESKSLKIIKTGTNVYETNDYVDFFVGDNENAIFGFVPLFKSRCSSSMKFHIQGGFSKTHGISWDDYNDDTYTDSIPKVKPISAYPGSDVIEVTFACDKNIVLKIHCWTWANKLLTSNARLLYDKKDEDDIHQIEYMGLEGKYAMTMYMSENQTSDSIGTLYFCKPLHEYLDIEFAYSFDELIPEEVRQKIEPQIRDITKSITFAYRSFDHFPYCTLNDFSLNFEGLDPSEKEIHLFTFTGRDRLNPPEVTEYCFTLDFYLDWME